MNGVTVKYKVKFGKAKAKAKEKRPKPRDAGPSRIACQLALAHYVDRLPDELAASQSQALGAGALDAMHFAWAGGREEGEPHYYRLQAPRFLVEYDCTQNDANHIHAVWRDPEGDFGEDLLARHYAEHHSQAH